MAETSPIPDSPSRTGAHSAPPRRPVILYDATCPFCRRNVRRLVRLAGGRVDAVPAAEILGDHATPGEIKLLMPDGRMHGGADGVLRALAERPVWRPIVWVGQLPGIRRVPQAAYQWVSKRRHRLGRTCTDEVCSTDANDVCDAECDDTCSADADLGGQAEPTDHDHRFQPHRDR